MGVCRIAVCHDCGCYIDLDKMYRCWESDFWWNETFETLSEEYQEELRKDQVIYELYYAQILCRFYSMHWGHNVKIYSDGEHDESYYNVLYVGGNCDNEKALKEVTIGDLNTESGRRFE